MSTPNGNTPIPPHAIRLSSRWTYFYKCVFRIFWFQFLALFTIVGVVGTLIQIGYFLLYLE
jgi:hypothetical protein